MIDLSKVVLYSQANSFKNTGLYPISLTLSGTVGAGVERQFTASVTLADNQRFVFAKAKYNEFIEWSTGVDTTSTWQQLPTFNAYIPTTPTGFLSGYVITQVNGNVVTFIAGIYNPYGVTETITGTTIDIVYATYSVDS